MTGRLARAGVVVAVLLTVACGRDPAPPVDPGGGVIFHNGVIVTMDGARPRAEAMHIRGDRIVAVGSNAEVMGAAGTGVRSIDLDGGTIVPGFIDAHGHRVSNRYHDAGLANNAASAQFAVAQGWTGVHELFVDSVILADIMALEAAGQLPLRIDAYLPVNDPGANPLGDWYVGYRPGQILSPHVRIAGLKFFVDVNTGTEIRWSQAELTAAIRKAHGDGWQIAAKAIGSPTLEMILNSMEAAQGGLADTGRRHRIEHILSVTPAQAARLRAMGISAIFQTNIPGMLVGEADIEALIDREPAGAYAPWRSLHTAGVRMAGGTGWPSYYVDEPDGPPFASPLRLLYQAATRTGHHGSPPEPWMLAEAITVEQALRAYTLGSAEAALTDHERGSLAAGKLADFVVLSGNPLDVAIEEILKIDVRATVIGGQGVHCAGGFESFCGQANPAPTQPRPGSDLEVAVLAPTSGQHAQLGQALRNAAELAFLEVGGLGDLPVKLTLVDDGCAESGGQQAATAISANANVVGVLGPACSASAGAALPVLEAAGIPAISGAADGPQVATLGPTVFSRTVPYAGQPIATTIASVDALEPVQAFYARYQAKFGALPAEAYRPYLAFTYDAAAVLAQALRTTATSSSGVDRAALAAAVRATSGYQGITGTISFDTDGNRAA
jgi:predicted amidohydrolase YtcJ/ABC-type branched-subunit amino acid transport system substrate-binding protein